MVNGAFTPCAVAGAGMRAGEALTTDMGCEPPECEAAKVHVFGDPNSASAALRCAATFE